MTDENKEPSEPAKPNGANHGAEFPHAEGNAPPIPPDDDTAGARPDPRPLGKVAQKWVGLKPEAKDPNGNTVDKVYVSTDHFIIYAVTNGRRMSYILPEDYDSARRLRRNLAPVAGQLARVSDVVASMRGALSDGDGPPTDIDVLRERTLDLMARAMQLAFEEERDTASGLLASALEEVTNLRDSRNRMRYIWANTVALVGILTVAYLVIPLLAARFPALGPVAAALGGPRDLAIGQDATLQFRAVDVLAFGALGAFFSVSAAIKEIRVSHAISLWEMLYAGAVRIPIGVIAAAVVIVMISGAWILGAVEPNKMVWALYLFGFIAGFSEYFVPNALKQAEGAASVKPPGAK